MLSGAGEFVNLIQDELGLKFIPNAGDNAPSGPLQKEFFLGIPDWSNLIGAVPQHTCRLYLP
jgi:hypothetical protein